MYFIASLLPNDSTAMSNTKMNRQFTSSLNGNEEEFSAEELQEFAQAFKVIFLTYKNTNYLI